MNAIAAFAPDSTQVKTEIRNTLKGPVLKILRQILPTLHHIPEKFAYDHILGSIHLLDLCLKAFRRQRAKFNEVLLDTSGNTVLDDSSKLRCGRAVADVVSMVVRTSARRYFNHKLTTEADELYDSIKEYLLFDWQVPLVPSYADMTPLQVRKFGAGILELNTKGKLARALGHAPPPMKQKAKLRSMEEVLATGAKPLKFQRPEKKPVETAEIGTAETPTASLAAPAPHTSSVTKNIDPRALSLLANGLGLERQQLVAFVQVAHLKLGDRRFLNIFARSADPTLLARLIKHAGQSGISAKSSLKDIALYAEQAFGKPASTG